MSKTPETEVEAGAGQSPWRVENLLKVGAVLVVAVLAYVFFLRGTGDSLSEGTTFAVRRGTLKVTINEGGNIEAQESQEIRSKVKGREGTKILSIVDEGYQVTREDVENGLVLVELDSSNLEDRLINQEIGYEGTQAQFIETQAEYEIQVNQNKSDIKAAELKVKFDLMDFEKFLGEKSVSDIIKRLGLDKRAEEITQQIASSTVSGFEATVKPPGRASLPSSGASFGSGDMAGPSAEGTGHSWGGAMGGSARAGGGDGGEAGSSMGGMGRGGGERSWGGGGMGRGGGARSRGGMGGGGGERSWGGMGGAQGGASGAAQGGIPVDDELIEAIAESMREQGFPVEPDRLKMMLTRGGGMLTPPMIERMEQMGMGIKGILEKLGKKVQPPADEPAPSSVADPMRLEIDSEYVKLRESIDFSAYADVDLLEDGSAKKDLRELEDKLLQTEDEREFAQIELDGIRRLAERDFATKKELDRKEITLRSRQIQFEAAGINQGLYIKYEFPKQAERLLSDYEEALMKLERTVKTAYARLSQKEARLKSAERRRGIEGDKVNDLREQMENCVILAEREGLVVYGSSGGGGMMYRGGGSQEPIDEGTTVRERQLIITIPDMNLMGVSVKVHESAVQMVKKGQRVTMTVDARPEQVLEGEVMKVSVLPDSNNFFFNPDLKVYPTTIQIEGVHEWLRPGMSAQVQIRIKTLEDVLYVPIQAVSSIGEERVCYVVENGKPKRRLVEIGSFTEEFVEIVSGLQEGDVVLLRAPDPSQREEIEDSDAEEAPAREVAATEASEATAS